MRDLAEPGDIPVQIGWHVDSDEAALAFLPPEPLDPAEAVGLAPGPVGAGLARRLLVVRAPYNVRVRITPEGAQQQGFFQVRTEGDLTREAFRGLFTPLAPGSLRRPGRAVVQVSLNFCLVTEEPCALTLLPPFLASTYRHWPGPLICGRFPLRAWPRVLNAAMEWEDRSRDWVLSRGDPLAYIALAFDDPRKVPVPVEAATTPAFRRHFRQVSGVIEYARNVAPMMAEAERRRPPRLFVPKLTGTPDWDGCEQESPT